MNFVKSNLGTYLVPKSLNMNWNFGFILGMLLTFQILSGFLLTFVFLPSKLNAFGCLNTVAIEGNVGWFIRLYHSLGVSAYFLIMFFHIIKGIWYSGKYLIWTWSTGIVLLLTSIAVAFMGYVLPDGQMSFWGSTVIANLMEWLGKTNVIVFGGYTISGVTLHRFYIVHVYMPIAIFGLMVVHLYYLHRNSSTNPMSLNEMLQYCRFFSMSLFSDIKLIVTVIIFIGVQIGFGNIEIFQADPDNSEESNELATPPHIIPEWYLLLFYATLKVLPTKIAGLIAIAMVVEFLISLVESRSVSSSVSSTSYHRNWTAISMGMLPIVFIVGCLGRMIVNLGILYFGVSLIITTVMSTVKMLDSSRVRC
nr:cytochrome b [Theileria uilenbergi]